MKKYVLFGAGSFLSDIFDLIHANDGKVTKIYQNVPDVKKERVLPLKDRITLIGYDVELYESLDSFEPEDGCEYVLGCIPVQKYVLIDELKSKHNITISTLIHPKAHLGSNVHVGEGVIINAGAVIAPNAYLDDYCSINRCATVGHDAKVGKYSRIGPSVALAGSTQIGDCCSIGINATILDAVHVGRWTVIGAGSVVTKDIEEGVVAMGVPAKVVKKNEDRDIAIYKGKRSYT